MKKLFKILSLAGLFFAIILIAKAEGLDIRGPQPSATTTTVSVVVTFPIAELGNCNSKVECKTYCDKADNISACATFAQSHGLISAEQKQQADKLSGALKKAAGPGKCTDAVSCSTYCADSSHTDECVAFAKANNLIPKEKLDGAKKVGQALKSGSGPGGCKNENECRAFCSKTENQQTCIAFGEAQGLVKKGTGDTLQKFNNLVKSGSTPGGCISKEACQRYCQDQSHKDECVKFLVKLGVVDSQTASKINQSGTKGPGGCDSSEACKTYCSNQTHEQECIVFAKERGLEVHQDQPNPQHPDAHSTSTPSGNLDTNNHGSPSVHSEGVKDCLFKALGLQPTDTLDTQHLTEDQKAAVQKCQPQPQTQAGQKLGEHAGTTSPSKGSHGSAEGSNSVKECLQAKLDPDGFQKLMTASPQDKQQYADALKECGYPLTAQPPQNGSTAQGGNSANIPSKPSNPGIIFGGQQGGPGAKPPLNQSGQQGSGTENIPPK